MNGASGAVFLSYASQDAEAARRIAEALRAAGVEVWFDQAELVGGDAWDQKIRGQISSCALFVPIISGSTQARLEGYFRREWKQAASRTHDMADEKAFLLPVVIDDMRDADAKVPAEFKAVQWTRLRPLGSHLRQGSGGQDGEASPPGGEDPALAKFAARVSKLLANGVGPVSDRPSGPVAAETGQRPDRPNPRWPGGRALWIWLGPALVIALITAFVVLKLARGPVAAPASVAPKAPVTTPVSEARRLTNQALQLLEDPNPTRESSWLADELCERALRLDLGDAEVWAVAALASANLYSNVYDTSAARREKARMQAERARQLDPGSVRAGLAAARYQLEFGSEAEAKKALEDLHAHAPGDQLVLFSLIRIARSRDDDEEVARLIARLRALPRTGVLSQALWFDARALRSRGRFAEAEKVINGLLAESGELRGALYEKLILVTSGWQDWAAGEEVIKRLPERYRQEPAFAAELANFWLMRGSPQEALEALAKVPQDYLEEFYAREPRALLAGWAHAIAGRFAAAKAEWQSALAVVEGKLKDDPRNTALAHQRVLLLGLTGQTEAARAAWEPLSELTGGRTNTGTGNAVQILTVLGESEAAVASLERRWPSFDGGQKARLLNQLDHHPAYAPLRDLPRVRAIREEGRRWMRELKTVAGEPEAAAPAKADDKSVAVLAFANLSDDRANEYFSDGISEELLNVLAKVPGLKVSARTSAFYFKGRDTPIPEIARQLGVAYVVEGSVRKAGDKVRITTQLIKAADGFRVWNDTFTRDLKDIFAVQDEIAALIAKSLSLQLGASSVRKFAEVTPQAFEHYVQARQAWSLRTPEGFARAEQLLDRALELSPDFVRARAALIDVVQMRSLRERRVGTFGSRHSPEIEQRLAQVRAVLAIDPELAEAYSTLGQTLDSQWLRDEAGRAYRRATELNPNYATGRHWYGMHLAELGRMDEALAELKAARDLDPFSFIILDNHGWLLNLAGRRTEALQMLDRAAALNPGFDQTARVKAAALKGLGRTAEAEAIARGLKNNQPELDVWTLGSVGLHAEAKALLARLDPRDVSNRFQALLAAGEREAALDALSDPSGASKGDTIDLLYQPIFDPIRTDPRFARYLATLGLVDAHARAQAWRRANPPEESGGRP